MTSTLQLDTDQHQGRYRPISERAPGPKSGRKHAGDNPLATGDLSAADQRRLRQSHALRLAESLDSAETLAQRVEIYRSANRGLLHIAAALWPDLMPLLNGELEWIALTSV